NVLLVSPDIQGELPQMHSGLNGNRLATLNGDFRAGLTQFSPDGNSLIIAYYSSYGELLRTDGTFIKLLSGRVNQAAYNPSNGRLIVGYDNFLEPTTLPAEMLNSTNGAVIQVFSDEVEYMEFSPNGLYLIIDYVDKPGELRSGLDGTLIREFPDELQASSWTFNPLETFIAVIYETQQVEIFNTQGIYTASLNDNLRFSNGRVIFLDRAQTATTLYQDNHAYLLDIEWLNAMLGEADTLLPSQLISLACQYPLNNGEVLDDPELLAELQKYLDALKVCEEFSER
ncbi:MAG: WD40 repeat domain-containing protein, partial [Anaerolineales bacterium]|nr:WD40 repeat domain-containing protein [Anaerolineales bacterium]